MHADAVQQTSPKDWNAYFERLNRCNQFQGGSAIGEGETFRKSVPTGPVHRALCGFIRVLAIDLDDAKQFLEGNPVFEAGGTVEIRELPRT